MSNFKLADVVLVLGLWGGLLAALYLINLTLEEISRKLSGIESEIRQKK